MATSSRVSEDIVAIDEHGKTVQSMFSDIAHGYDRANRWMSLGIDRSWRKRAVAQLLPDLHQSAYVLDLCAGTMDSSQVICRHYPQARVRAGDFSAGMLEHGRRRLDPQLADRIDAQQMDAHAIPADDDSFDAVFCAFGLRNLSDLPSATSEMRRCLRPGGRLVILEFFRPTTLFTRSFHGIYNHTVLPAVGWACTGNLAAYRYLPRSISGFVSIDAYAQTLREAGFEDVLIEPLTFGVASIVQAHLPATDDAMPRIDTEKDRVSS